MKHFISFATALLLLVFSPCILLADESGSINDMLMWSYADDGSLQIYSTDGGETAVEMGDYSSASSTPWYSYRASITNIYIGEGVASIGAYAFYACTSLETVVCASSVFYSIGKYAFAGCSSLSIIDMSSVTQVPTIGTDAFSGLAGIVIELSNIQVIVPSNLYSSFTSAETWSSMTIKAVDGTGDGGETYSGTCGSGLYWTLTINDESGILNIYGTGEMDSYFGESVPWENYGQYINSIVIDEGVTSVGDYAFYSSGSSVKELWLASTVSTLNEFILSADGCSIYVKATTPPSISENTFGGMETEMTFYVPTESYDTYQNDSQWMDFNLEAYDYDSSGTTDEITFMYGLSAGTWKFLMLPGIFFDGYFPASYVTTNANSLTWAYYDGSQRAQAQSGWTYYTDEAYDGTHAYIVQATDSADLIITLPGGTEQLMVDVAIDLESYSATHAENANWNFLGNPYPYQYNIQGFADLGVESPITVWNGTGYDTYTPGIDSYLLQPFEAFFIQASEDVEAIYFLPSYIVQ